MTNARHGKQLLQYGLVLLIAITLNFALPRLMPGNPLALIAGVDVGLLTPEERAEIRDRVGLDQPLHQQYLTYLGDVLTGDFGYSYRQKQPITEMIMARLPWTLLLTLSALAVSALVGIILGAIAAWRRASRLDMVLLNGMIVLDSLPSFWLGMLFIAIFAVQLGWFPSQGAVTPASGYQGIAYAVDVMRHAALPVLTLSLLSIPRVFLTMRYSMCSVLGAEFIRTARAKGISDWRILVRHMIPNAMLPVVTVLALRFGFAFGGTVVIETVFSYPGLGRLIFEAVSGRDYPVMQAAFLLFTAAVLLSNLLADWLYPRLDPRARAA
ncbi:MAG: ABC transporter permease [Chloroflexi bacterium]|nr:ABC transporter permease [Chloroflexota bacterium]